MEELRYRLVLGSLNVSFGAFAHRPLLYRPNLAGRTTIPARAFVHSDQHDPLKLSDTLPQRRG